jgi:hypothetical protein
MVWLCRTLAILLLVGAAVGLTAEVLPRSKIGSHIVNGQREISSLSPGVTGVKVGDRIDMPATSTAERYRLVSPVRANWKLHVIRQGTPQIVTVTQRETRAAPIAIDVPLIALFFSTIVSVIVGAFTLWRRPSPATLFFGLYCAQTIPTIPTISLFESTPDWFLGAFAPSWVLLTNDVGIFALAMFALRFPEVPQGLMWSRILRIANFVFAGTSVFFLARAALVFPLDFTNVWIDTAPAVVAVITIIAIVSRSFARAGGEARRRLGWVLAGVISGGITGFIGYSDSNAGGPIVYPVWISDAGFLQAALPLLLGYAILRHRVLDIGLAINRGLVYATITLTLVILVSFVDWLSGRFIGGRFSLVLEALVTVAFGVALNWFHARIETIVDRVFFRERYRAERHLTVRIRALDFASQSATVDRALVVEAGAILKLVSAAVYRRTPEGGYACAIAHGWESTPHFDDDDLIVRTLRAGEKIVVLDESGIQDDRFPLGDARPDIVIPLAIRHELRGFLFYGHRTGGATLDPEERGLLERLSQHAATAYDAIEADAYRTEALHLRALVGPLALDARG